MNNPKDEIDEMRTAYRLEDLGKGVRGKYHAAVSQGSNLALTEQAVRLTGQTKPSRRKRVTVA